MAELPMSASELRHAAAMARRIEPSENLTREALDELAEMFERAAQAAPERNGRRQAVLDQLSNGPLPDKELLRRLGGSYGAHRQCLHWLRRDGLVERFRALDQHTGRMVPCVRLAREQRA